MVFPIARFKLTAQSPNIWIAGISPWRLLAELPGALKLPRLSRQVNANVPQENLCAVFLDFPNNPHWASVNDFERSVVSRIFQFRQEFIR
jgi:hypothetical protein